MVNASAILRPIGVPPHAPFGVALFGPRPEGAKQISPGQRPGYADVYQNAGALKGRNIRSIVPPIQGSSFVRFPLFPRALPWAGMWLPLRGVQIAQHQNMRLESRRCWVAISTARFCENVVW